jgi:hypothetical protein
MVGVYRARHLEERRPGPAQSRGCQEGAEGLSNRLKKINLTSDAVIHEKSPKIGRYPDLPIEGEDIGIMVIASDQRERGNPTKSSRGIRDAVAISVWDCFITSFLAMTAFHRQFWDISPPCLIFPCFMPLANFAFHLCALNIRSFQHFMAHIWHKKGGGLLLALYRCSKLNLRSVVVLSTSYAFILLNATLTQ